jgi:hypothetical protein
MAMAVAMSAVTTAVMPMTVAMVPGPGALRYARSFVVHYDALRPPHAQNRRTRIGWLHAFGRAVLHDAVVAHRARRRGARVVVFNAAAHRRRIVEVITLYA